MFFLQIIVVFERFLGNFRTSQVFWTFFYVLLFTFSQFACDHFYQKYNHSKNLKKLRLLFWAIVLRKMSRFLVVFLKTFLFLCGLSKNLDVFTRFSFKKEINMIFMKTTNIQK